MDFSGYFFYLRDEYFSKLLKEQKARACLVILFPLSVAIRPKKCGIYTSIGAKRQMFGVFLSWLQLQ